MCYRVLVAIESNDLVIRTIERIHHNLSGLREGVDSLREAVGGIRADMTMHGDRLAAVETGLVELRKGGEMQHAQLRSDILVTSASLGVLHERLSFFERAATIATEGRARLDDRVDRQQRDVDELGEHVSAVERRVDVLELG